MKTDNQDDISGPIIDAAAEWFVEFSTGEPDVETKRAFDQWLRKSPEHVRAYLEFFPMWDDVRSVYADGEADAEALIQRARSDSGTVASLPARSVAAVAPRCPQQLRSWSAYAAMAVTLTVLGLVVWLYARQGVYTTGIGEERVIVLEDGSSIAMNARSSLRVSLSRQQRYIEMRSGQALFRVAKESGRPFIVASNDTRVRALGTEFDVYKKATGTRVTVLEGRVLVSPVRITQTLQPLRSPSVALDAATAGRAALDPGLLLDAGDQAMATAASIDRASHPDIGSATAWREHRLVFSGAPLQEVAEEFNRYNDRQIVVHVIGDATLEVSGAFSMTDVPSLLRFLRAQSNIDVREERQSIDVVIKR